MIYVFYFLSGLTALIYEVVWSKRLGLIFGVDSYAVTTVLAVFFLGLAIGAKLAGRIVNTERQSNVSKNPLLLYGLCEVGIGLYAVTTPYIFLILEKLQILFNYTYKPSFGSFNLFTFLLSMAALILPTMLIGATFPIVAKVIDRDSQRSENVGLLYGVNTLGAAIGTLISGFFLVYFLGIRGTIWIAALINVGIGLAVLYLAKDFKSQPTNLTLPQVRSGQGLEVNVGMNVVVFLTGLSALALEILWTRALILTFGPSTFTFTIVLANFLLGIGFGSLIGRLILRRVDHKRLVTIFAISLLMLGIFVVLSTPLFGNLPLGLIKFLGPTALTYVQVISSSFFLSFLVLFIPTSLMGMSFVWLLHLTGDAGQTYFLNTIGAVVGSILAGFSLLPLLGIQKSILIISFAYFLCSFLVSLVFIEKRRNFSLGIALVSLVSLVIGFKLPSWDKNLLSSGVSVYFQDYLQDRESLESKVSRGKILYYKEGLSATVMVKLAPEGFLFLRNNGKTDASTDQDLDDLHLIGSLPLILHQDPQEVLVIGMGSGITAGSVASHPVNQIDVVEIEPAVFTAAGYFESFNNEILKDQRLNRIQADARFYLRSTVKKYDVITSQPSNLWVRGNASLFTKDFFEISKKRLKDDGLMLQWIPFYSFSEVEFKTAVKTFSNVFPYVTVWTPVVSHDVLLIGSKLPQRYDLEKIASSLSLPQIQKDLETTQIRSAEHLVAHYLFDEAGLKNLVDDNIPVQTDDKPILEFSSAFSLYKNTEKENLTQILAISGDYSDHIINSRKLDKAEVDKTKVGIRLILGAKLKTSENQLAEATEDFEKALKIIPKTATKKELARVYFELARRANEKNDIVKTIFFFEESVNTYPTAKVYLNLAIIYSSQNRLVKARDVLEKAKKLDPDNPRITEIELSLNK